MNDVQRIYENIAALLTNGTYPGGAAGALAEAQQFVANILAKLNTPAEVTNDGQAS